MAAFERERRRCGVPIGVVAVQHSPLNASRAPTSVSASFVFSLTVHGSVLAFALMGPMTTEPELTEKPREVGEHLEYALILPTPAPPKPATPVAPREPAKKRGMPKTVLPKMQDDLPFTTDLLKCHLTLRLKIYRIRNMIPVKAPLIFLFICKRTSLIAM